MTIPRLRLDHLTILVSSMETSRRFHDVLLPLLGFSRTTKENWTDGEGFFLQFREAKPDTRPYERYAAGLNHLGFGAPDERTVHAIRERLIAAGYEQAEVQDLSGAKALFVKDPDGLRFEITYYPPGMNVVD